MACEIHFNDIGTSFRLTIYDCQATPVIIDVSAASVIEIKFRRPDYTSITKTGVFYTDGTDGIIEYVTVDLDLDAEGTWSIQAKVTLPTGTWSSNLETFEVKGNI